MDRASVRDKKVAYFTYKTNKQIDHQVDYKKQSTIAKQKTKEVQREA
jgi:hypothetical protein